MTRTTSLQLAKKPEDPGVESTAHTFKVPVPNPMYDDLQEEAQREHWPMIGLIKRYLKMGLYIDKLQREPDTELIVRRRGQPDEKLRFL